MKFFWSSVVLPILISGLVVWVSQALGGGFRNWVLAVVYVVGPIVLIPLAFQAVSHRFKPFAFKVVSRWLSRSPVRKVSGNLTYADVAAGIEILTRRLEVPGSLPDLIVGVDRGGAILGGILAKRLNCPFAWIGSSKLWSLSTVAGSMDDGLRDPARIADRWQGRLRSVLVVDDACRSGSTLAAAVRELERTGGFGSKQIKTAVLLDEIRPHKGVRIDFSVYTTHEFEHGQHVALPWDLRSVPDAHH
jgi:hypoxanthine phosphoribosyltransferase